MQGFDFQVLYLDHGITEVVARGHLDAHTFGEFERALDGVMSSGKYYIILDLSEIEYMSSAGMGTLIGAQAECEENGGEIVLVNPSKNATEVMAMIGMENRFNIVPDRLSAMIRFE